MIPTTHRNEKEEHKLQKLCYGWTRAAGTIDPRYLLFFSIDHGIKYGGDRNQRFAQAREIKARGIRSGIPDMFLPVRNSRGQSGLWVELKTAKGQLSDAQKIWKKELENQGFAVEVARSLAEFTEISIAYLN